MRFGRPDLSAKFSNRLWLYRRLQELHAEETMLVEKVDAQVRHSVENNTKVRNVYPLVMLISVPQTLGSISTVPQEMTTHALLFTAL